MKRNIKIEGIKELDISELSLDDRNANLGTELGKKLLRTSIHKYGAGRGVLVDKNLKLIAGNHAVQEMKEQGIERVIVVPTDGKTLVVTQRTDIDKDSKVGHELALADNRTNQANLNFDLEVIQELNAEFDLDLDDLSIDFNDGAPSFSDEYEEEYYGEGDNSKSTGGETIDESEPTLFAVAVSLTRDQRKAFDFLKRQKKMRTDTDAFLFMLKMCNR